MISTSLSKWACIIFRFADKILSFWQAAATCVWWHRKCSMRMRYILTTLSNCQAVTWRWKSPSRNIFHRSPWLRQYIFGYQNGFTRFAFEYRLCRQQWRHSKSGAKGSFANISVHLAEQSEVLQSVFLGQNSWCEGWLFHCSRNRKRWTWREENLVQVRQWQLQKMTPSPKLKPRMLLSTNPVHLKRDLWKFVCVKTTSKQYRNVFLKLFAAKIACSGACYRLLQKQWNKKRVWRKDGLLEIRLTNSNTWK